MESLIAPQRHGELAAIQDSVPAGQLHQRPRPDLQRLRIHVALAREDHQEARMAEQPADQFLLGEDRRAGGSGEMRSAHDAAGVAVEEIEKLAGGYAVSLVALHIWRALRLSENVQQRRLADHPIGLQAYAREAALHLRRDTRRSFLGRL